MFKIHSIVRRGGEDETEFSLLGQRYRLIARPIYQWHLFYWGRWSENSYRWFAIQSPWLTIVHMKP